jgi:hypothetical protein
LIYHSELKEKGAMAERDENADSGSRRSDAVGVRVILLLWVSQKRREGSTVRGTGMKATYI